MRRWLLLMLVPLAGCGLSGLNAITVDEHGTRDVEVPFGTNGLQLDVYLPKQAPGKQTVVFLYGGAWQDGARGDYRFMGSALTQAGFNVVLPDYRQYPEVQFPAFVHDAAQAVCWAQENAHHYGWDRERVAVMGHSAGAHIAALLHFDETYLETAGCDTRTNAFVGLAGPYDFRPLVGDTLKKVFPEATRDASQPVSYVDGTERPVLLLHGLQDNTVKPRNSAKLAEVVARHGGTAKLQIYDKQGHAGVLVAFARPLRRLAPVVVDVTEFFEQLEDANVGVVSGED